MIVSISIFSVTSKSPNISLLPTSSLPLHPPLLLFNDPLNSANVAYMCTAGSYPLEHGQPTSGYTTKEPSSLSQWPPAAYNSSAGKSPSSTQAGSLAGLILYTYDSGNYRCCEFLSVVAMSCPKESMSQHSLHPLLALPLLLSPLPQRSLRAELSQLPIPCTWAALSLGQRSFFL